MRYQTNYTAICERLKDSGLPVAFSELKTLIMKPLVLIALRLPRTTCKLIFMRRMMRQPAPISLCHPFFPLNGLHTTEGKLPAITWEQLWGSQPARLLPSL